MFKRILLSTMLGLTANIAVAIPAPYVGASLGLTNATTSSYPIGSSKQTGHPTIVYNQPANFRGIPFSLFVVMAVSLTKTFT